MSNSPLVSGVVSCKHGTELLYNNEFTSVYSNPGEMEAVIPPPSPSVSAEVNDLGQKWMKIITIRSRSGIEDGGGLGSSHHHKSL